MSDEQPVTWADLAAAFTPSDAGERIGIEVENGLVDPATGCSIGYERQVRLLDTLITELPGAAAVHDGPHLVGVELPGGASLTLETGGALEYSSACAPSLADPVHAAAQTLTHAADIARSLGIALLSGGSLPFTKHNRIPWIPKPRVQAMRDYFHRLGEPGRHADPVMGLILSTQTSLDYLSIDDMFDKLRLQVLASPIVAALCVNSPLDQGTDAGVQSRRMQFWTRFDPRRCGVLEFALDPKPDLTRMIEWAAHQEMIYRRMGDSYVAAPRSTFAQAMAAGFGDGAFPTLTDWRTHLCQFWPHVRVRHTLELRAADGLPWPHFPALPAVWTGLTYDPATRAKAIQLLQDLSAADLNQAVDDIAVKGLHASIGCWPVRELAIELLKLARDGLTSRVNSGKEPATVLAWLEPLEEVADTGETFADRCLDRWNHEFQQEPSKHVRGYRI